ncbi:PKD domain-containing protein, partial [Flavobacteriales bacterium]|nr:PKD domain-containing protein [Flavobacteriales bacterium]
SGISFSLNGNVITVSGISNLHIPDNSTRYITLASVTFTKELGVDTLKCKGENITLDAGNIGATYLWNTGDTSKTIQVITPGTYWVRVSSNGCFEYDTVVVTDQVIDASFSTLDTSGCVPVTINFTDLSIVNFGAIVQWGWKFGDGSFSAIQNPVKTYTTPGTYSVELEVTSSLGCKDDTVIIGFIDVYPFAVAEFDITPAFTNTRELVTLSNFSTNALSFKWYFGDGDSSILAGPTHEYLEEGLYEITLIAMNAFGCNDTIIKTIEIKDELYFIANSFTPYPEGKNQVWGFVGLKNLEDFELQVFDRWGEIVFETTEPTDTWDGKHEDEICPQGAYVWKARMKFKRGKIIEKMGHVNILK